MPAIQTDDVSDEALITAIRANLNDFYRRVSRSDSAHFENENFTRWHTPLQHPWFNGILSVNPPAKEDETVIDESIRYFRSKGIRAITFWMEPRLTRRDWEPVLTKFGFRFEDGTPGMAVDLQVLNESLQPINSFEVRVAADEESTRAWTHAFTIGYGLPLDWEDDIYKVWSSLGSNLPIRNYLGFLNGEPVGTSCLFIGGGAAGIYSVSTLPQARGKGIGAALTLKPLQDAREMGYRIGVLQSSEMGYNIYKRLGFRHLCQIENFYLPL